MENENECSFLAQKPLKYSNFWLAEADLKSIWDGGQPFPTCPLPGHQLYEVYLGWRTTIPNT